MTSTTTTVDLDDDYRPGDEFDWNQSDPTQFCEHGTFTGSWWGPDLMCGPCESGVSGRAYRRGGLEQAARRAHHEFRMNPMVLIYRTVVRKSPTPLEAWRVVSRMFSYYPDYPHWLAPDVAMATWREAIDNLNDDRAMFGPIPDSEWGI